MRPAAVFGDIHGNALALKALLDQIQEKYGTEIDLYHVGDLIDRGKNSKKVIQLCIDYNIQGVMGNHDSWMHLFATTGQFNDYALSRIMAGDVTLDSYDIHTRYLDAVEHELQTKVPKDHLKYIENLPLSRTIIVGEQKYRLTHAGLKKPEAKKWLPEATQLAKDQDINLDDAILYMACTLSADAMIWVGPKSNLYKFKDGSIQIYGHCPHKQVKVTKHWIALDTGSSTCPPYKLSAITLPTHEVLTA